MPLPKNNLLFGFKPKLTDEQGVFVNSIFDNQLTIVDAKAGTGKTLLAVACSKIIGKDLMYIFSPVQEHKIGFLPGSQEEKEYKYTIPLHDALAEIGEQPLKVIYSEDNPKKSKEGNVWVYPTSHIFLRGTNIKDDKTVIIDEVQNCTVEELKKILTRVHNGKVILIGHSGQIDLQNKEQSGFQKCIDHFKNKDYCCVCELTQNFRGRLSQDADELH